MRKIMQEHSTKWMQEKLNISAWRYIAIGISHQFLRVDFKDENPGDVDLSGF